ncbi:hypothetical protein KI387_036185, partial [Taxus chinensis]
SSCGCGVDCGMDIVGFFIMGRLGGGRVLPECRWTSLMSTDVVVVVGTHLSDFPKVLPSPWLLPWVCKILWTLGWLILPLIVWWLPWLILPGWSGILLPLIGII